MTEHPALECFGLTDPGTKRPTNEDAFLTAQIGRRLLVRQTSLPLDETRVLYRALQGYLLVVADGLGGQPAGEVASEVVVSSIAAHVLGAMPCLSPAGAHSACGITHAMRQALADCHAELVQFARRHPGYSGLGTTLTMALVVWPKLYVLHVGDSRCYVYRNGTLTCLTPDQTVAQSLVDSGSLAAATARRTAWRHLLLSAVDDRPEAPEAKLYEEALLPGDVILLCTDGLTAEVPDATLARTLAEAPTAQAACEALVQAALRAGGSDNVTAIVARHHPAPAEASA